MVAEIIKPNPALLKSDKFDTGIPVDPKNPTAVQIQAEISRNGGRIPYSKFMEICLYGHDGFYSTGKVEIDPKKDFITIPEETTIVGNTIAKTLRDLWTEMGKPQNFDIVEMGGGKGGLAHTILTWTQNTSPDFHSAIRYRILEYGSLIQKQKKRLAEFADKIQWIQGSALAVPLRDVSGVFLSNELVDAFPAERVLRIDGKIRQKYIRLIDGTWHETWEDPTQEVLRYIHNNNLPIVREREEPINLYTEPFQKSIDKALERGAAITIDYGQEGVVGYKNILAARFYGIPNKKGSLADIKSVYENLGNIDITTNVNFTPLNTSAKSDGLEVYGETLATFLAQFGANEQVKEIEDKVKTTASWKELLALTQDLRKFRNLVRKETLTKFYVQMAIKGLKFQPSSQTCKLKEPGFPTLHVPVGAKKSNIELSRESVVNGQSTTWIQTTKSDANGYLPLAPYALAGLVIKDKESQQIIFDFSDPAILKSVVTEIGCDFDIDQ